MLYIKNLYSKKTTISVLLFLASLLLVYLNYHFAEGLKWSFDDYINLKQLEFASDKESALDFIFNGIAGPTGRPISLLTFMVNYADWPNNPWGFIKISIIIHCINSALVFIIALRLFDLLPSLKKHKWFGACITGIVWATLPIHASGILMAVQRMTLISAFFIFLTLYIFILLRSKIKNNNLISLLFINTIIIAGGLLAIYSKENGIIVITLIALLEIFFFRIKKEERHIFWKAWLSSTLIVVPLLLLIYFTINYKSIQNNFHFYRGYELSSHIATQLIILWDYIKQIILPRSSVMGPFHDDHITYTWKTLQPWIALSAWILTLSISSYLYIKKNSITCKMLLFSILFYLASHQIESTFIPLELYFEHRNYVASLGIVFFVAILLSEIVNQTNKYLKSLMIASTIYIFYSFSLFQITTLWAQPLFAAEMWYKYHPNSPRAVQSLSSEYSIHSFENASQDILTEFSIRNKDVGIGIQSLFLSCKTDNNNLINIRNLSKQVAALEKPASITTYIDDLGELIRENKCGISLSEYDSFLDVLLENEKINRSPRVRHHVHYEKFLTLKEINSKNIQYIEFGKKAFYDFPSLSVGQNIALSLFSLSDFSGAIEWIENIPKYAPSKRQEKIWTLQLENLRSTILAIQEKIKDKR